jgi:hypothetical protein
MADIQPSDNIFTRKFHRVRWPYIPLVYNSTLANVSKGDNILTAVPANPRFVVPDSGRQYKACTLEIRAQAAAFGQNTITPNQVALTAKPTAIEFGAVSPASQPLLINGQPFVEIMAIDNFGIAKKTILLDSVRDIRLTNARCSYTFNFADFAPNTLISLSPAAMTIAFSLQFVFVGYFDITAYGAD